MAPFSHLLTALEGIKDPRRGQGKRYKLPHLLLFCILGILSGAKSYSSIQIFIRERNNVLQELYGIELRNIPCVNTFRTLIQALTAEELETMFRQYANSLQSSPMIEPSKEVVRKRLVALDGKTLKHSFDHMNDQKAAQILSAFACDSAIIIANAEVDIKTNEIPVAQELIRSLGLKDVIFTADAMHCQKKHSRPLLTPEIT